MQFQTPPTTVHVAEHYLLYLCAINKTNLEVLATGFCLQYNIIHSLITTLFDIL